jgi:hypothetical protein
MESAHAKEIAVRMANAFVEHVRTAVVRSRGKNR